MSLNMQQNVSGGARNSFTQIEWNGTMNDMQMNWRGGRKRSRPTDSQSQLSGFVDNLRSENQ